MSIGISQGRAKVPSPDERPLWRLAKAERVLDAYTRPVRTGTELCFRVDDEVFWCRVYRNGAEQVLRQTAADMRRDFEAQGWT